MAKEEKEKTFEENLENLEKIVKDLESGNIPLDDAIEKFTEAMKLAKLCDNTNCFWKFWNFFLLTSIK